MMDAHPQLMQERRNFFVKLRQPVSAGEEILVDYRYSESDKRSGVLVRWPTDPNCTQNMASGQGKYGKTQFV